LNAWHVDEARPAFTFVTPEDDTDALNAEEVASPVTAPGLTT
jgi:hypothetical protein